MGELTIGKRRSSGPNREWSPTTAVVTDLPNSIGKKKSRWRNERFQFWNENSTAKRKNLMEVEFDYNINGFRSEKKIKRVSLMYKNKLRRRRRNKICWKKQDYQRWKGRRRVSTEIAFIIAIEIASEQTSRVFAF